MMYTKPLTIRQIAIIRSAFPLCWKCGKNLRGHFVKPSTERLFRVECVKECKESQNAA